MLNCIEEILYYHRVDTSEFFIGICHSRSIGHWCCTQHYSKRSPVKPGWVFFSHSYVTKQPKVTWNIIFFLAIHQTLYYDYGQLRLKYFTFTVCYKQVDKYNISYNKRIYSYISISSYIFHIYLFFSLWLYSFFCYDSRLDSFNFIPIKKQTKKTPKNRRR